MMTKYALITGGAQRIGAAIAKSLHKEGYVILLHYGQSEEQALTLQTEFNTLRPNSCFIKSVNLSYENLYDLSEWVLDKTKQLDVLVNNASLFFPSPWQDATKEQWDKLFSTNVQVPFFLIQVLLPALISAQGSVINMIDIHEERSLELHPIYSASKSALKSLTLSLAKDMAGRIRCNGISPGAILWPEQADKVDAVAKEAILKKIPMNRLGAVDDIASAVLFLLKNQYINVQVINIDGGRTVFS
jgi:pteridine reductase